MVTLDPGHVVFQRHMGLRLILPVVAVPYRSRGIPGSKGWPAGRVKRIRKSQPVRPVIEVRQSSGTLPGAVYSDQQFVENRRAESPVPVDRHVVDRSVGTTAASSTGRIVRRRVAKDSTRCEVAVRTASPANRKVVLVTQNLIRFDRKHVIVVVTGIKILPVRSQRRVRRAVGLRRDRLQRRGKLRMERVLRNLIVNVRIPRPVRPCGKRIGQVISNLLTNSLRYTPQGGSIEIGLKKNNSMVEVWVKDSGAGIPSEELPFIFERFYRVDKSRARTSGGTGLGLAIAKYFVDAQGGHIHAESEVGKGTCITFSIPIAS